MYKNRFWQTERGLKADIDTDIGGARDLGINGALVKTGKFCQNYFESSLIQLNWIIDSIADLPRLLTR